MHLAKLTISNFRKHHKAELQFQPGLNVLVGANNVGKTAVVDALRALLAGHDEPYPRLGIEDVHRLPGGKPAGDIIFHYIFRDLNADEEADFLAALKPNGMGKMEVHITTRYSEADKTGRLRAKRWCGDHEDVGLTEVAQATLIDLAQVSGDWVEDAQCSEFFILGYPADHSFADYDNEMLCTDRITLHARYIGRSFPYLHEIEISDRHTLKTFSGFSGAPVFAWTSRTGMQAALSFCGMALRGSAESGRIHFLDRSVLLDALKVKRGLESKCKT
ncbi:MAG: AAA family ATPase [Azonexus sp.]